MKLRKTTLEDLEYLCSHLREEHIWEIQQLYQTVPDISLIRSVIARGISGNDFLLTAYTDKEIIGVVGSISIQSRQGIIYFWGTEAVDKNKKSFVKMSSLVINFFENLYDVLFLGVNKNFPIRVKWLKRLGFKELNDVTFNYANLLPDLIFMERYTNGI
jgi:hypothetical protein